MSRELKKIMTDLAAGRITQEEADKIIKPAPKKKHTQKRKLNPGGKK